MGTGLRYRLAGIAGTVGLTVAAVALANLAVVQRAVVEVLVLGRLRPVTLGNGELSLAVVTAVAVAVAGFFPLYKPQPRRVLDTLTLAGRRVLLVAFALAAVGYFDYTYRLPRTTLLLLTVGLAATLPAWFVLIRRRPGDDTRRAVIVGDDPATFEDVLGAVDAPVIGYVSPPASRFPERTDGGRVSRADGGRVIERPRPGDLDRLDCLGGLSRLEEVIVDHDVDTAILAFAEPDRTEFFGVLDTCHGHGVTAKVHQEHADAVLTRDVGTGDLVDVDLEPWDPQDYVLKRAFDVAFAVVGMVVLAPLALVIAAAIKLDSDGPVFYRQTRTAAFGGTFEVYKFRTMVPEGEQEDTAPTTDADNDRITRVGRVLRRTHLDELPQLWSILTGRMSAVGPRAAWVEEENLLEERTDSWRCRWFVRPGLTGLAQINGVESTDPEAKLRYDVAYIRNQSFWFDLKIVVRQVWMVLEDVIRFLATDEGDDEPARGPTEDGR